MIYTVTLNPSLDYIVDVENLTVGAINRSTKEVVNEVGEETRWVMFVVVSTDENA